MAHAVRSLPVVCLVGLATLASSACSQAFWQGMAEGAAAASGASASHAGAEVSGKLMIFGGQGHNTYLGCLNCSKYASDSIFNEYGNFGSAYSATSVHNKFGDFGSRYSTYSACNPYASDPPVIVDGAGQSYGRLTVNAYNTQATRNEALRAWLAAVCEP